MARYRRRPPKARGVWVFGGSVNEQVVGPCRATSSRGQHKHDERKNAAQRLTGASANARRECMTTMMLQNDVSIDRHARVRLIRDVFARSPLFREAVVSGPVLTRDGEVGLDISFDGGPTLFRVVAGSEDRAYAALHELALAMVEVDLSHGART